MSWILIDVLLSQTAVVKECLRLSNTVPGFLPRRVPKDGVDIGGYHVPGGVSPLAHRKGALTHSILDENLHGAPCGGVKRGNIPQPQRLFS